MKRLIFALAIIVAVGVLFRTVVGAGERALHKTQDNTEQAADQ